MRPALLVVLLLASVPLPASCAKEVIVKPTLEQPHGSDSVDPHSYANPLEARVTHVALDVTTDFTKKVVAGTATLTIERAPGAQKLVLDTRDLKIARVTADDGAALPFTLGTADKLLGAPLTIELPASTTKVSVAYETGAEAQAIQWLTPAQTSGGKQPFLFTQGQAILTRTWVPLQDSPGIRITYEATVHAPKALTAVMSAEPVGAPVDDAAGGTRAFRFTMPERIPPYLIALAVGELAFRPLGTRTGVYAEPSVVDAAAWEFADTEKMVEAAEALYGPYRWGRYDILLLPPSFPFGGMENPRLTFASPTVLAGDRSLVSLIAHELAHSWSGNLVTNATWADFWLNEGMTVYFEGRIIEALYGRERTAMDEVWGMLDLEQEMDELGRDTKKTALHRDLRGEDPDDGVNGVPYVKGATFLRMLEKAVGREALDAFLKRYFDDNAFTSMTTARFLARVKSDLLHGDAQQAAALKLDEWVYEPAWPSNKPTPTSTMLEKVDVAVHAFAAGAAPSALDAKGWVTQQTVWFLKNLPREQPPGRLKALDDALALSSSKNSEILFEWLTLAIANQYEPAVPVLEAFVTRQGRRRLVLPLYEDLVKTTWGKPIAVRIYAHARPGYHPLTAASVDEVLASH